MYALISFLFDNTNNEATKDGQSLQWSNHAMALHPPLLLWWMRLPLLRAKRTVGSASMPMSSSSLPAYLQMLQAHLQHAAEVRTIHTGKHKAHPRCGRSLTSNVTKGEFADPLRASVSNTNAFIVTSNVVDHPP